MRCAVPDGAGGWYLGGFFPAVDDFEIQHLVHVLPSGEVDPGFSFTFGGVDSSQEGVLAMDLSETGVLYISGSFSSVNGEARSNIAAIDTTTGTLTDWAPALTEVEIDAVLATGDVVYVGEAGSLAAVDAETGVLQALNSGNIGIPYSLLLSGNILYIGGTSGLTAYDINADAPLAWNPAANGPVRVLLLSGGTIYAGGEFTNIGGQDRSYLAAVSTVTGNASSWNPAPDAFVSALSIGSDSIYVGGAFSNIGGQARNGVAEVGITNDDVTDFDPRLSRVGTISGLFGIGSTLLFSDGKLLVGGSFTGSGAVARRNIAALDAVTGAATDWAPEADNLVNRLLLDGDTLYVAGTFNNIGGQPRSLLAALDVNSDTNNATGFVANCDNVIRSFERHGDDLYIGGIFNSVNGETREKLASVNATTGAVTGWDPSVTGIIVDALDIMDNTVYVGGNFTEIGVSLRSHIGAVNAGTGVVTSFDPTANAAVSSLLADDGKIYVSGSFGMIGGEPRNNLAELDAATGLATDRVLDTGTVVTLAKSGNTLFLAGSNLFSLNGGGVVSPAAYDLASDTVLDWQPIGGSTVFVRGDHLYTLASTSGFLGGPRITPGYIQEFDLGSDRDGISVDFAAAYATLTASLAPGVVDGDLDDDGLCDLDEFDCFADLLAAGDASGIPTVASTFLLNRAQMRRDLGDDFLSLVSGANDLFAAWLMLDDVAWVEGFLSGCGNCQREYSASSYDLSLNTAIETESASCTIAPCAGNEGEGDGVAEGEGEIDYDVCPGDSMQSQPPDRVTQFVEIRYSDANRNRIIYENFNDLTSDITGVSWWGFGLDTNDGATECVRDPNEFLVSFYADGGGAPLNIVDSFAVTPVGEPAFAINGGPTVLRYSVTFNSPIPLSTGWVKIQGVNNTACDWAWYPSLDGDDLSVEEIVGASQTIVSFNPAICISGVTPEGEGQVDGEGEGVVEGEGEGEGVTEGEGEGVTEGEGVAEGEGEGQLSNPYEELLYTFASADADGNSLVTLAEILVQLPKFTQEDFDAADANDDGSLSVAELLELSSAQVILSADTSGDYLLSLSELLRAVQIYNAGGYACAANPGATEDGYTSEEVPGLPACVLHGLDRNGDNQISLSELLRGIQIFSFAGYNYCDGQSEDDFCDQP